MSWIGRLLGGGRTPIEPSGNNTQDFALPKRSNRWRTDRTTGDGWAAGRAASDRQRGRDDGWGGDRSQRDEW